MFWHILKKDLKRKKTMNLILLLFVLLSTLFLASSMNNLLIIFGAVGEFMETSMVPDYLFLAVTDGKEDVIKDYLSESSLTEEYQVSNLLNLSNENIEVVSCAQNPDNKKYEKTNTLSVGSVPDRFMKVFEEDNTSLQLASGEIALPRIEADANHLQPGDQLKITVENVEKTFTVKAIVKDAVFGSAMIGYKRFLISQEDFNEFAKQDNLFFTKLYSVNTKDQEAFQSALQRQGFQLISTLDKATVRMTYIFDMLMAAILILVSVCLILIAFLILRFTIVFTLQEDYREIGIMKAIGIRDFGIRSLYLIKYFSVALVGAGIGLAASLPVQEIMLQKVVVNIVLGQKSHNYFINVACAAAIVLIVISFCYGCTGRLKRFTAMEAIRNGSGSERFRAKNVLMLSHSQFMKPYFYMACNDILSSLKRYVVLIIIFCLGTMMILLPLSAVNTLKSEEIIYAFSMVPSTAYLSDDNSDQYVVEEDGALLQKELQYIKETLKANGLDCKVHVEIGYTMPCHAGDKQALYNYFSFQNIGDPVSDYRLLEGSIPVLENEVIVTQLTAEKMGIEIGDSVYYQFPDGDREFVVTGLFESMMNMGQGYRVSEAAQMDYDYFAGVVSIQVQVLEPMEQEEALLAIREILPDYKVESKTEYISKMIGGIMEQLDSLIVLIVGVVLMINCLITVLMMKTFISKEHGEIAMLKSIGFCNRSIKAWQATRILLVLICSIALGVFLSKLLSPVTIVPIFGMMGAPQMKLMLEPLQTYLLYPLLLLTVTGLSAFLSCSEVDRVDLKEINSME